jgi:hemolysin D
MPANHPENSDKNSSALSVQNQPVINGELVPIEPAALVVDRADSLDWSDSATALINTVPLPWTRGLLYFLLLSVSIILPWSFLYQIDEIGRARGRLEYKGDNIKREADIDGSVAVLKVYVKKGDPVVAGQKIMELDAKSIREQIYQSQLKIDSDRQRLGQLMLMKNQMRVQTSIQEQQNQSQQLEKKTQISQAQQLFADRQANYNLQQAEKIAQIRQAQQKIIDAQSNLLLSRNRYKDANNESYRYRKLYRDGATSLVKSLEIDGVAKEKKQILVQAQASLKQSELQLIEQQENYRKLLQQGKADIARAKLQIVEQQRNSEALSDGGNIAVIRNTQQLKELENQVIAIKSEITRGNSQLNYSRKQLEKYTIKADIDGTIFELPISREGSVVQPKQLIAEIAPTTSKLVFKGEISTEESESIRSGERKDVKLKFDEFPFESYDIVKGHLTWVSPNSKISKTLQGNSTSYEVEVRLEQSCIKHKGKCLPFKSGQPATAEIVIRHRKVIDFVLDPFRKLADRS